MESRRIANFDDGILYVHDFEDDQFTLTITSLTPELLESQKESVLRGVAQILNKI